MASPWAELPPVPPSSSSEFPGVPVSDTTGPANGRAAGFSSDGTGPPGPKGNATGTRLFM